ncbi:ferric reductase like transmembrane component-domain-containing protein [Calycina marina]|uniref:ferric-chelate reductase (NADPH) n=1 Tax=Calycina marina TaxID=1763456 RepID=A0A9P7Z4K8_9HELO|nr:ferric reductase like transmembrane component-domain-containing protein [Calycina marina]
MSLIERETSAGRPETATSAIAELARRVYIPLTSSSPPGLIEADTVDPWSASGKYALGWTYFCLVLLVLVTAVRIYHAWTDKLRQAMHKQEVENYLSHWQPEEEYGTSNMETSRTVDQLFPRQGEKIYELTRGQSHWSSIGIVNDTLALFRWVFYRPVREIKWKRKILLSFPSLSVIALIFIAVAFTSLYCFLPQPLFWQSIQYGSPPLAIRSGMMAVAIVPWIVAIAMKANLVSIMTGISHNRLQVFHRWGGYLCLFLSIVHTVPFYIQPVWDDGGRQIYYNLFHNGSGYVYGTGIACLVPLGWLCIASLPIVRNLAYEIFVLLHIPVSIVFVGLLFWHCNNYLKSWNYLWATIAIWVLSYAMRVFNLNWFKPWRNAWLIGDEAAVTLMAENAIKVTIPTQMTWRPGQFVYLRMPGISVFENHPFTISSLCSEDFPSEYGDLYRDCTLVFRPFGGFTRKVLETAIENGPFKTYRAYLDGPYGGMQRELAAFDTVILFAGGSGITAIVSQLLELIKRMRDGKSVTKKIEVVWALKRLEAMDWFREELRICREFAPPDTVTCQFYVTAAKRQTKIGMSERSERAPRPISTIFHDKLDGFVAGIASRRNSAMIRDEAQGDPYREAELRAEQEDAITSLPRPKHLQPRAIPPPPQTLFLPPPSKVTKQITTKMARKNSLKALEEAENDDHAATRHFLTLPSTSAMRSTHREFHFPPPSPSSTSPKFNYIPPSPRGSYNSHHWPPPPPPGPPPKDGYRPDGFVSQASQDPRGDSKNDHYEAHEEFPPKSFTQKQDKIIPARSYPPPPPEPESIPQPPQPAHLRGKSLEIKIPASATQNTTNAAANFDFGFPSTPTEFQKNLMRFAFVAPKKKEGWSTEYGRPDLGYMLKDMATGGIDGKGIFGRRTCVFVCGPPGMRVDVANTVAGLQADIWGDDSKDEIFLHTENYAI